MMNVPSAVRLPMPSRLISGIHNGRLDKNSVTIKGTRHQEPAVIKTSIVLGEEDPLLGDQHMPELPRNLGFEYY